MLALDPVVSEGIQPSLQAVIEGRVLVDLHNVANMKYLAVRSLEGVEMREIQKSRLPRGASWRSSIGSSFARRPRCAVPFIRELCGFGH